MYNCPNDRHGLVLVSEKHRLNENVIYVPENQHCLKTYQWIQISLFSWKITKLIIIFFPYASVALHVWYHLCAFRKFIKDLLFWRVSVTAPLQENIAALQMLLRHKIFCHPSHGWPAVPTKVLINCFMGTYLYPVPGLQELPSLADSTGL